VGPLPACEVRSRYGLAATAVKRLHVGQSELRGLGSQQGRGHSDESSTSRPTKPASTRQHGAGLRQSPRFWAVLAALDLDAITVSPGRRVGSLLPLQSVWRELELDRIASAAAGHHEPGFVEHAGKHAAVDRRDRSTAR
jgi:hypothetical protein